MRTTLIAASFICIGAGSTLAQQIGDKMVVTTQIANVKPENGIAETVSQGNILTVKDVNGEWLLAAWPSGNNVARGWISRSDVIPFDEALDFFNDALRRDPNSRLYYIRGMIWEERAEYVMALKDYTAAIQLDPKFALAYNNRGNAWNGKGDYDVALKDYTAAIRLDPKFSLAYNNRGNTWNRKGEYAKAIADYTTAIQIDPKLTLAYNNRGNAWYGREEYGKAIADYSEAIRIDPNKASAFNNRGNVWNRNREYDKAIADYDEAIRLDPKNASACYNRGNAWNGKGEFDKAIADYSAAIRIDPKFTLAYDSRGLAWRNQGDFDKAIADYNEAIRLDPKYANPYSELAWLLATCLDPRFRDGPRAVQSAMKGCELTQWKNANSIGTLAAAYAETGDFVNAVKWQEKSLELTSEKDTEKITERLALYKSGMPYREGRQPN